MSLENATLRRNKHILQNLNDTKKYKPENVFPISEDIENVIIATTKRNIQNFKLINITQYVRSEKLSARKLHQHCIKNI